MQKDVTWPYIKCKQFNTFLNTLAILFKIIHFLKFQCFSIKTSNLRHSVQQSMIFRCYAYNIELIKLAKWNKLYLAS